VTVFGDQALDGRQLQQTVYTGELAQHIDHGGWILPEGVHRHKCGSGR
jgi:hypothetical protein